MRALLRLFQRRRADRLLDECARRMAAARTNTAMAMVLEWWEKELERLPAAEQDRLQAEARARARVALHASRLAADVFGADQATLELQELVEEGLAQREAIEQLVREGGGGA